MVLKFTERQPYLLLSRNINTAESGASLLTELVGHNHNTNVDNVMLMTFSVILLHFESSEFSSKSITKTLLAVPNRKWLGSEQKHSNS